MMEDVASGPLPDLNGRDDIKIVVDAFYAKIRDDDLLGFIFNDIAGVDWETHLPKMYDFWDSMIFRANRYHGNPVRPHMDLEPKTEMGPKQFERWQTLFFETIDQHFTGEKATHLKSAAADMAQVLLSKVTGVPRTMTFAPDAKRPTKDSN